MSGFNDFADQLQQDVVSDMAKSYFGARKDLDNMIDAFHSMVSEFSTRVPKLSQAAARLHLLLLNHQTALNFYITLDIMPSCIPFTNEAVRPFFDSLPFAFTELGRYERCVCRAYDLFQKNADEYLNGVYYIDPEVRGRKRLTVHYVRLKALAEHINDEVERINNTMSPSGTLRYVKGMDPVQVEKERIIGEACLTEGCALDRDLKFTPIDFEAIKLPVVQDLPSLYKVKTSIRQFCKDIYSSHRGDIANAMALLRTK
ncbi:MAG: hypothetical protein JEY79_00920 [Pseudodesulfovibrio sp.]|nr:hypothetical protein [Pseudodesulfovibrio sp.]